MDKVRSDFNIKGKSDSELEDLLFMRSTDFIMNSLMGNPKGQIKFSAETENAVSMIKAAIETIKAADNADKFIRNFGDINNQRDREEWGQYNAHGKGWNNMESLEDTLIAKDKSLFSEWGGNNWRIGNIAYRENAGNLTDAKSAKGTALAGQMLVNNLLCSLFNSPLFDIEGTQVAPVIERRYEELAIGYDGKFDLIETSQSQSDKMMQVLGYTDGLRQAATEIFNSAVLTLHEEAKNFKNAGKAYEALADFCRRKAMGAWRAITLEKFYSPANLVADIAVKQDEVIGKCASDPFFLLDSFNAKLAALSLDKNTCNNVIALLVNKGSGVKAVPAFTL